MIRSTAILTLEEWKNKDAILTVTDALGTREFLELVTVLDITPFALHCRDAKGKTFVYVFAGGLLKGWEAVTEEGLQEIALQQNALKAEETVHLPPPDPNKEPTVVRKILTAPVPTKFKNGMIEVDKA
jgi:hypothetical protein